MPIQSPEGQSYLAAMAAAANFAFANRSLIMSEVRSTFEKTFGKSAREVMVQPRHEIWTCWRRLVLRLAVCLLARCVVAGCALSTLALLLRKQLAT
jgi:hypothetical protein